MDLSKVQFNLFKRILLLLEYCEKTLTKHWTACEIIVVVDIESMDKDRLRVLKNTHDYIWEEF